MVKHRRWVKTNKPTNPPKVRQDLHLHFSPILCSKFQSLAYSCAEPTGETQNMD